MKKEREKKIIKINGTLNNKTSLTQFPHNQYGTANSNNETYTGHYTEYNVHYYFQLLVSGIRNYRYKLNSNKYWEHFLRIGEALAEYHRIIKNNDLNDDIGIRVTNLSTIIQSELYNIAKLKKSVKNHAVLVNVHGEISTRLTKLAISFENAINKINGDKLAKVNNLRIRSIEGIKTWIKDIRKPNKYHTHHSLWHMYHNSKKLFVAAVGLFFMGIGAAVQSTFAVLTEMYKAAPTVAPTATPSNTTAPTIHQLNLKEIINHFGLAASALLLTVIMFSYILISTDQARKVRHAEQWKKAEADYHYSKKNGDTLFSNEIKIEIGDSNTPEWLEEKTHSFILF